MSIRRKRVPIVLPLLVLALAACRDSTGLEDTPLPVAWRTTLPVDPNQFWIGRPAANAQRVIVEGGNQLFGLDAVSGQLIWQRTVRVYPAPAPTKPLIEARRVFLAEVDSTFAFDVSTGARLWTFHPDSQGVVAPAVDGANVYIGQRGIPVVYALDKVTGALRWRSNLGVGYIYGAAVRGLAVRGDTVYAAVWRDKSAAGGLSSGVLVALAASGGAELWRYETPGDAGTFVDEPQLLGDTLVINDFGGDHVTAIDLRTHGVAWRSATITARLVVSPGAIYGGGNNGTAYRMAPANGGVLWSTPLGSFITGVALCGGQVWVTNGNLHRVDAGTGAQTGRLLTSNPETFISDLGMNGDRVFVAGGALVTAVDCR